jgi:hypothetical protein
MRIGDSVKVPLIPRCGSRSANVDRWVGVTHAPFRTHDGIRNRYQPSWAAAAVLQFTDNPSLAQTQRARVEHLMFGPFQM